MTVKITISVKNFQNKNKMDIALRWYSQLWKSYLKCLVIIRQNCKEWVLSKCPCLNTSLKTIITERNKLWRCCIFSRILLKIWMWILIIQYSIFALFLLFSLPFNLFLLLGLTLLCFPFLQNLFHFLQFSKTQLYLFNHIISLCFFLP